MTSWQHLALVLRHPDLFHLHCLFRLSITCIYIPSTAFSPHALCPATTIPVVVNHRFVPSRSYNLLMTKKHVCLHTSPSGLKTHGLGPRMSKMILTSFDLSGFSSPVALAKLSESQNMSADIWHVLSMTDPAACWQKTSETRSRRLPNCSYHNTYCGEDKGAVCLS